MMPKALTPRPSSSTPPSDAALGRTSYHGINGPSARGTHPVYSKYEGIFTNRSQTRMSDIRDGTIHTLMFGEFNYGVNDGVPVLANSWMGIGSLRTIWGMGPNDAQVKFGSMHPGIVQYCFADGHVRALKYGNSRWNALPPFPPESSDWWVYQELAGMRDGGVRDTSALLP